MQPEQQQQQSMTQIEQQKISFAQNNEIYYKIAATHCLVSLAIRLQSKDLNHLSQYC